MITVLVQGKLQLSVNGNCSKIEEIKKSDADSESTQQLKNEEC